MKNKIKFILASSSPRRKELLSSLFFPFEVRASNIEEFSNNKNPADYVQEISYQKGEFIFKKHKDALILSADTIVYFKGEFLGKPKTKEDAYLTLKKLSGNTHEVYTGVTLFYKDMLKSFFERSEVTFIPIKEAHLQKYIETSEPFDKAGAYGIQGYGVSFIKEIKGSYSNVVGLPVDQVLLNIENMLEPILGESWRDFIV